MPRSSLSALSTPGHHVGDHFHRRVPDAQLLTKVRIEGFEERLVEIRHRFALVEPQEERGAVYAVQAPPRSSPTPRPSRAASSGRGRPTGWNKRPQHGCPQMPDRLTPSEALLRTEVTCKQRGRAAFPPVVTKAPTRRRRRRTASGSGSNGRSAPHARPRSESRALPPAPTGRSRAMSCCLPP